MLSLYGMFVRINLTPNNNYFHKKIQLKVFHRFFEILRFLLAQL